MVVLGEGVWASRLVEGVGAISGADGAGVVSDGAFPTSVLPRLGVGLVGVTGLGVGVPVMPLLLSLVAGGEGLLGDEIDGLVGVPVMPLLLSLVEGGEGLLGDEIGGLVGVAVMPLLLSLVLEGLVVGSAGLEAAVPVVVSTVEGPVNWLELSDSSLPLPLMAPVPPVPRPDSGELGLRADLAPSIACSLEVT